MVGARPVRLKGLRSTNTYFLGPLSDVSCWAGPFTGQQHLHKGNPPLMALVCSRLCKAPWHRQALQTALPPPVLGPPLTSLRGFCFLTFKKVLVLEGWNDAKECSANSPRPQTEVQNRSKESWRGRDLAKNSWSWGSSLPQAWLLSRAPQKCGLQLPASSVSISGSASPDPQTESTFKQDLQVNCLRINCLGALVLSHFSNLKTQHYPALFQFRKKPMLRLWKTELRA